MAANRSLRIFPHKDDEDRFLVGALIDKKEDQDIAVFIGENERIPSLKSLLHYWEELSGGKLACWIGSLWDVPLICRLMKELKTSAPTMLAEVSVDSERDQTARQIFLDLLPEKEELLSHQEWQDLAFLCQKTALEFGQVPWSWMIYSENSQLPEDLSTLYLPHLARRHVSDASPSLPAWVFEASELIASASLQDNLGHALWPERDLAKAYQWTLIDELPPELAKHSPIRSYEVYDQEKIQRWEKNLPTHVFSASQLECYARSPFWYYAEQIIDLKPLESELHEVEAYEIGSLVHRVLEFLYQSQVNNFAKILDGDMDRVSLEGKVDDCVASQVQKLRDEKPALAPLLLERHQKKISSLVHQVIKKDLDDMVLQSDPLLPTYFEWSFGMKGEKPLTLKTPQGRRFSMKGRIDRIDVDHQNKKFLLIDYKTGSGRIGMKDMEQGRSLQLQIYLAAVQQLLLPAYQALGAVFYSLADLKKQDGLLRRDYVEPYFKLSGRLSSMMKEEQWDALLESSLWKAGELVDLLYEGRFTQCEKVCVSYCPYQDICGYERC
jgi:RecB family exonuclease